MGKGDRKTKRGKIFKKSYGKHRPRKHSTEFKPADVSKTKEIIEEVVAIKEMVAAEHTPVVETASKPVKKPVKKSPAEKKPKVVTEKVAAKKESPAAKAAKPTAKKK
jgi:ribosomal small subunit protein bTHX